MSSLSPPHSQPERIKGSSPSSNVDHAFNSYTVSADVWSLGISIVEIARGKCVFLSSYCAPSHRVRLRYPYPPETYENVFAQLSAIVDGEAPGLPDDDVAPDEVDGDSPSVDENGDGKPLGRQWSPEARDWVRRCLIKNADERATYPELLASVVYVAQKVCADRIVGTPMDEDGRGAQGRHGGLGDACHRVARTGQACVRVSSTLEESASVLMTRSQGELRLHALHRATGDAGVTRAQPYQYTTNLIPQCIPGSYLPPTLRYSLLSSWSSCRRFFVLAGTNSCIL